MFGIAWGIISITLMVAAGEGLRVGQAKVAEQFAKDILIVHAGRTSLQAGGVRAGRRLCVGGGGRAFVREQSPDCRYVLPELGQGNVPVRSPHNSAALHGHGSCRRSQEIRSIPVAEGRYPTGRTRRRRRRVAFIGSDAKKQLFGSRPAMGETLQVGDFPYTIVGVMQHKEQDSSYDGRDISKVFVPFSAMLRDFPNRPPATPQSVDRLLAQPRSIAQHDDLQAPGAARARPRATASTRGTRRRRDLGHGRGGEGLPRDDRRHEVLPGRRRPGDALDRRHRRHERDAGGGARAHARDRRAQGGGRHARARSCASSSPRRCSWCSSAAALGLGVAYGLCALVNLIPMPPFFAGLLPTWSSALLAFVLLGTVAVLSALYPASRAASVDPIEALRTEVGG